MVYRSQNFGLGLASNIWPRPGLDLVVLLCNRAFFGQKSCKIREFCYFFGNNLKSYVFNHYLVLFHNYFCPRPWSQPPEIGLGLSMTFSNNIHNTGPLIRPNHLSIYPGSVVQCQCQASSIVWTLG